MSDTTLNQFVASGTAAERAAYTPSPPTVAAGPDSGYFFFETDTGLTYSWNGATWVLTGGGSTAIPSTAQGDMLYASAVNTLAALNKDTNPARYLSNTGTSNNPAWAQVTVVALTAAHGTDDTYTGTAISGLNAGATIAQWEAVYLGASSTWLLADANGASTYPARGLAVAAYSSTDPAIILVHGTVRNDAWNWTPGGTIYLSGTAGALTQTAPSTSGDKVQQIGFALTADIAFFDFNSTYLTVT